LSVWLKGLELRGFRDRDFVETPEGFLFCVVGCAHPEDRVIAYLKYVPSESGKWGDLNRRFSRTLKAYTIPDLRKTIDFIGEKYPQYLYYSDVFSTWMTAVPKDRIVRHYIPEQRLRDVIRNPKNVLERRLEELTKMLVDSGVELGFLGVTGSILLGIHQPFSDIDLTVYGMKNSKHARQFLEEAVKKRKNGLNSFQGSLLKNWIKSKVEKHPITVDDARRILSRKWNMGVFKGVRFSIHPVRLEHEAEPYGARLYRPRGEITIRATVSDASESMFLPAIYKIRDVEVIEGPKVEDLVEACSYESLYDSLAEEGERIQVRGRLELVIDRREKREYYRVLVGSLEGGGKEYIKPLPKAGL